MLRWRWWVAITMLRGQGVGIEAHLVNLSKLAHLALVIYRRQRTKFIPAQNFQNTMRMIRAMFWMHERSPGVSDVSEKADARRPLEAKHENALRACASRGAHPTRAGSGNEDDGRGTDPRKSV